MKVKVLLSRLIGVVFGVSIICVFECNFSRVGFFDKAFPDAWRVAEGEVCILKSFCRFEVRGNVENGFLLKFALIYPCIQESYFCIWDFSLGFYGRFKSVIVGKTLGK